MKPRLHFFNQTCFTPVSPTHQVAQITSLLIPHNQSISKSYQLAIQSRPLPSQMHLPHCRLPPGHHPLLPGLLQHPPDWSASTFPPCSPISLFWTQSQWRCCQSLPPQCSEFSSRFSSSWSEKPLSSQGWRGQRSGSWSSLELSDPCLPLGHCSGHTGFVAVQWPCPTSSCPWSFALAVPSTQNVLPASVCTAPPGWRLARMSPPSWLIYQKWPHLHSFPLTLFFLISLISIWHYYCFCFVFVVLGEFWPRSLACRISVPLSREGVGVPAGKEPSPNHPTAREFLIWH